MYNDRHVLLAVITISVSPSLPSERASIETQLRIVGLVLERNHECMRPVRLGELAEIHASGDVVQRVLKYYIDVGFIQHDVSGYAPTSPDSSLSAPRAMERLRKAVESQSAVDACIQIIRGKGPQTVSSLVASLSRKFRLHSLIAKKRVGTLVTLLLHLGVLTSSDGRVVVSDSLEIPLVPGALGVDYEKSSLVDTDLYRRVLMLEAAEVFSAADLADALLEVRKAPPGRVEPVMKRVTAGIMSWLGFVPQFTNGPREKVTRARASERLDFGPEGDDIAFYYLRSVSIGGTRYDGVAIAAELKRGQADKKSVMQASTFRDRLLQVHSERLYVIPSVISFGDGYTEAIARTYATTSGVVHLPLSTLESLWITQKSRFIRGEPLMTPGSIIERLTSFLERRKVEPTVTDWKED